MIYDQSKVTDQKRDTKSLTSEKGIALIMLLWVLTILMVIVFSFSFMTRTETYATLSFKEGVEKQFLAEAGIERGIMEILYRMISIGMPIIVEGLEEGMEVWKIDGTVYTGNMGDGRYTVRITDESGKIDINAISDANADLLRNLLKNLELDDEQVNIIVDSILDWKDADDLYHFNGAETDYYMSLPNPYKAKNANFDTIEELLLVKGITPELLYGNGDKRGIIDFLTIYLKKNIIININAAPKEVLMAIPGMTSEIADALIDYREDKEIRTKEEISGILGGNYPLMAPYINTEGSNVFTIDASGNKGDEKSNFSIRATVIIDENGQYTYVYYKVPTHTKQ